MPVHDWTRVEAGIFHDFHTVWIGQIRSALNGGLLPDGYYALAEQHAGEAIADILALHTSRPSSPSASLPPLPPIRGGTAVVEAPPRIRRHRTHDTSERARRRTVAIRHVSGHRLIALLEIVSPANKDRPGSVKEFAATVVKALDSEIHVLVADLFPLGRHDPYGMHGAVLQESQRFDAPDAEDVPPKGEPLTLASYAADGPRVDVYLEHLAVGAPLPDMPLFLNPEWYVNVPFDATYQAAYRGVPGFWRDALEGRPPAKA